MYISNKKKEQKEMRVNCEWKRNKWCIEVWIL